MSPNNTPTRELPPTQTYPAAPPPPQPGAVPQAPAYQQPAYQQPVYQQAPVAPVIYQQVPVPAAPPQPAPQAGGELEGKSHKEREEQHLEVKLYSHSNLYYWWPVWVAGYAMALVTYLTGDRVSVGDTPVYFSHSSNPGVIFFLVLFLVILFTNMSVRAWRPAW